jgi:hypothetical protein
MKDVNHLRAFKTILLLCTACAPKMDAQLPTGSIIRFDIENSTLYQYDCPYSQLGTNPNRLDYPIPLSGIKMGAAIGDIVSVNGSPAKGTAYESSGALFVGSPNIVPGQPITDDGRMGIASWDLTFMNPDGTQIGAVHVDGMIGGGRTPGLPSALGNGAYSVTGGTGAFFGARGYFSAAQGAAANPPTVGERVTSACEDPSLRRAYADGRGHRRGVLYLIPLIVPEFVATAGGAPALFHGDFSPVTGSKPASAGEVLVGMARGLGPTVPGVDPGQPFPASPVQPVNSPVEVTVNGDSAEVINKVGWPGLMGTYRVDFRVLAGTTRGTAAIQLSAAWIQGPSVNVPVQ